MNFKILQVNGQDLSGASQEDATAAFTRAEEPITVVVRRATISNNCQQPEQSWTTTTNQQTPHQYPATTGVCASTQTSEKHQQSSDVQTTNKLCLCQHLMQLCAANPTSVFSTIILNELIRLRNESMSCPPQQPPAAIVTNPPSLVTTTPTQRHTENTAATDHMEVVLNRTSQRQKLGIVLRDHKCRSDGTIYVYISDIVKGSIADKCERLQSGDRVLSINGQSVASMSQAALVLQQQSSIIVLVVSRKSTPTSLDKQSTTIIGTTTQCSDHVTCKSPTSSTTNHKVNSVNQCLPPQSLPHATAAPQVGQAATTTGKNLNHQEPPKIASTPCETKGSCCNRIIVEGDSKSPSTGDLRHSNSYDEDTTVVNGNDPPHSLAHEFTFVEPKDYDRPTKPVRFIGGGGVSNPPPLSSPPPINELAGGVAPGGKMTSEHHHHDVIDTTVDYGQLSELAKLVTAIEHLEMEQLDDEAYEDDVDDDVAAAGEEGLDIVDSPFVVSPWVKIARQDYEDVMRAEKQINHRSSHHVVKPCRRDDNNRYHHHAITSNGQAGEPTGKRTSSVGTDSTSSAYSTGESMRSSSTASGSTSSSTQSSSTTSSSSVAEGRSCKSVTATSPPNCNVTINYSDENDGCYMTHDDYNSDDDVTTKKDAAAVATSPVSTPTTAAGVVDHHRHHRHLHHNELYKSSSASVSAESVAALSAAAATTAANGAATMEDQQHGSRQHEDKGHKSEWKVKIRRDGTRYITKRPTTTPRRERQSTSSNNDLVATDDEAVEVEGQSCSRAVRQHHQQQQSRQEQQQRGNTQRKRRRKQRGGGRLESLQENTSSSSSSKDKIAEMSRSHKVARRKRMLLGSFATVQEILAHGRANPSELAEVNPLLSVTYI